MLVERICRTVEAAVSERGLLSPVEFLETVADVLFVPLPAGRVRAASGVLPRLDKPLVVIDAGLSGLQRDAVACHEGAHVVLHPHRNRIYMQHSALLLPGRYETEADVFALAYLLRWDPGLAEQFGWDTGRLARACGLPGAVPYADEVAARVLGRAMHEGLWAP
jgi:Zn-dependent peptidase ImmA (M78 family)